MVTGNIGNAAARRAVDNSTIQLLNHVTGSRIRVDDVVVVGGHAFEIEHATVQRRIKRRGAVAQDAVRNGNGLAADHITKIVWTSDLVSEVRARLAADFEPQNNVRGAGHTFGSCCVE